MVYTHTLTHTCISLLVRARDCQSRGRRTDSGKNSKTENSNLHGFELHRPSSKGTQLLFQVIKANINQREFTVHVHIGTHTQIHLHHCLCTVRIPKLNRISF